jgi:hypothetical protein
MADLSPITWSGPETCPSAQVVRAAVLDQLGEQVHLDHSFQATAHVEEVDPDHFVLRLRIGNAAGSDEDEYHESTCDKLAAIASTMIAIAIDPASGPPPAAARPELPAKPAPAPIPGSKPAPQAEQPEPPKETLRGFLRVEGGVHFGGVPQVTGGVSASGGPVWRRTRIEVGATHWFAQPALVDDAGGEVALSMAVARGCGTPRFRDRLVFPICAGFELGASHGRGVGGSVRRRARLLWAAASASAGLSVNLGRHLALTTRAELAVPILRPGFKLDDIGEVFRARAVTIQGLLGLEVRFP